MAEEVETVREEDLERRVAEIEATTTTIRIEGIFDGQLVSVVRMIPNVKLEQTNLPTVVMRSECDEAAIAFGAGIRQALHREPPAPQPGG